MTLKKKKRKRKEKKTVIMWGNRGLTWLLDHGKHFTMGTHIETKIHIFIFPTENKKTNVRSFVMKKRNLKVIVIIQEILTLISECFYQSSLLSWNPWIGRNVGYSGHASGTM